MISSLVAFARKVSLLIPKQCSVITATFGFILKVIMSSIKSCKKNLMMCLGSV